MLGKTLADEFALLFHRRSMKAVKGARALAAVRGGIPRFVAITSMQMLDESFAWICLGETLANVALM